MTDPIKPSGHKGTPSPPNRNYVKQRIKAADFNLDKSSKSTRSSKKGEFGMDVPVSGTSKTSAPPTIRKGASSTQWGGADKNSVSRKGWLHWILVGGLFLLGCIFFGWAWLDHASVQQTDDARLRAADLVSRTAFIISHPEASTDTKPILSGLSAVTKETGLPSSWNAWAGKAKPLLENSSGASQYLKTAGTTSASLYGAWLSAYADTLRSTATPPEDLVRAMNGVAALSVLTATAGKGGLPSSAADVMTSTATSLKAAGGDNLPDGDAAALNALLKVWSNSQSNLEFLIKSSSAASSQFSEQAGFGQASSELLSELLQPVSGSALPGMVLGGVCLLLSSLLALLLLATLARKLSSFEAENTSRQDRMRKRVADMAAAFTGGSLPTASSFGGFLQPLAAPMQAWASGLTATQSDPMAEQYRIRLSAEKKALQKRLDSASTALSKVISTLHTRITASLEASTSGLAVAGTLSGYLTESLGEGQTAIDKAVEVLSEAAQSLHGIAPPLSLSGTLLDSIGGLSAESESISERLAVVSVQIKALALRSQSEPALTPVATDIADLAETCRQWGARATHVLDSLLPTNAATAAAVSTSLSSLSRPVSDLQVAGELLGKTEADRREVSKQAADLLEKLRQLSTDLSNLAKEWDGIRQVKLALGQSSGGDE